MFVGHVTDVEDETKNNNKRKTQMKNRQNNNGETQTADRQREI